MSTPLIAISPAKLNLFLHINGRREDGYHNLQTLFQLLNWGDTLSFIANDSGKISVDIKGLDIPNEQNLIWRAASKLQSGSLGAHITVIKHIPTGGGLGGGSSNAATTLLVLRHLWGLPFERDELLSIGAELGADVPVFIAGRTAWAEGIGDVLTPLELPPRWFVIIRPNCHVSTEKIFSSRQLTRDTAPIKIAAFFTGSTRNDCQAVVRDIYPEVDNALKWLNNFGRAILTGTGACVFASFNTKAEADAVLQQLPKKWTGFTAQGLNESPTHSVLV
ncbi:MAG: 4-(cytidine 5'-diphospho)-2-C-methyl-D-erythritol kinase [Halieaceae bacterium]|nr:4-(cytidine 5'-diphospho)-2-C-methyl-D-erythritol kinase [Halieaceae bacterium]